MSLLSRRVVFSTTGKSIFRTLSDFPGRQNKRATLYFTTVLGMISPTIILKTPRGLFKCKHATLLTTSEHVFRWSGRVFSTKMAQKKETFMVSSVYSLY